jgi:anthranilate/para-aminobenzoate synthase component I
LSRRLSHREHDRGPGTHANAGPPIDADLDAPSTSPDSPPYLAPVADVLAAWPRQRALALATTTAITPCYKYDYGRSEGWAGEPRPVEPFGPTDAATTPLDAIARMRGPGMVVLPYALGFGLEPTARSRAWIGTTERAELLEFPGAIALGTPADEPPHRPADATTTFALGPMRSRTGRARYEAIVARTIDLIRAGDCYQANLSHALEGAFSGSARGLAAALLSRVRPAHGAYVEQDLGNGRRRAIVSLSPELFLDITPEPSKSSAPRGRAGPVPGMLRVVARPMKGTRAAGGEAELERSAKDLAELAMIVDLTRNDLGRTCEIGSVRVGAVRTIESHASGVVQGTWDVTGRLGFDGTADGAAQRIGSLIAGAFPPGSVTGAPKVRAMQIIDELEREDRGVYCGSIGLVRPSALGVPHITLNVAIRTLVIEGEGDPDDRGSFLRARAEYRVGAGIVADSTPHDEWNETLVKAGVLRHVTTIEDKA